MKKKDIIEEQDRRIQDKLMGYQQKTVEQIVSRFGEGKNKCILADEVGLGKTWIAKGVISAMVKKANVSGSRPYRVAYICPNQNVSAQNFPKLKLYDNQEVNIRRWPKGIIDDLKNLLGAPQTIFDQYNSAKKAILACTGLSKNKINDNINDLNDKYFKLYGSYFDGRLTTNQREQLTEGKVFSRIAEWIIGLSEGKTFYDVLKDSNLVNIYLPERGDKNQGSSKEWADNYYSQSSYVHSIRRLMFDKQITILNNYPETVDIADIISDWCGNDANKKCSNKEIYKLNKIVANYLNMGDTDEQYRLSTLHVRQAINEQYNCDAIMQLDALTPQTSFSANNTYGSVEERAWICATYDVLCSKLCSKETFVEDPKSEAGNASVADYYDNYSRDKITINRLKYTDIMKSVCNELKTISNKTVDFAVVKEKLKNFNASQVSYDLVILDEFQNYSDVLNSDIIKNLFNNENTKVLMLSATPFAMFDYVDEIVDDSEPDEQDKRRQINSQDEAFEDFGKLIQMLIGKQQYSQWMSSWEDAMKSNNRVELEKLLYDEAGILRTERSAAAKHSPVIRERIDCGTPRFADIYRGNLFAENCGLVGVTKYTKTTPFALSFSKTYNLDSSKNNGWGNWGKGGLELQGESAKLAAQLFIGNKVLDVTCNTPPSLEVEDNRFKKLEEILWTNKHIANMLWLLPANSQESKKAGGVFKGMQGVSKTLIFSRYRMTPMSLTYLLCFRTYEMQKNSLKNSLTSTVLLQNFQNDADDAGIADVVRCYLPENLDIGDKIKDALCDYFVQLFRKPYAKMAVLANALLSEELNKSELDFGEYVRKYCEDGCLKEVLREYLQLLIDEYENKERYIFQAIRRMTRFLDPSEPELILWDKNSSKLIIKDMDTRNRFAAGLYAEKDKDATRRLNLIKEAFNSPFLPFVFSTTSIGTEGIDLHRYARNIIHWSLPLKPVDYEQREGRVLRFKCHSFRLNAGLKEIREDECVKQDWMDSGMFQCQLNYFSDPEKKDGNEDGCYHVNSISLFEKHSSDEFRYDRKMKIVETYRAMLGRKDGAIDGEALNLSPWIKGKSSS